MNSVVSCIPEEEYAERIRRIQAVLAREGLDAYLVHANEADQANVRYLSNHWSIFESCGVLVPAKGEAVLLIGPEAETYAAERSKIKKIRKLLNYREAAEPEYPEIEVTTFRDLFDEISNGAGIGRLGLGDFSILPAGIYEEIKKVLGKRAEIVRAEWIISDMRAVKSENEVALIKEAHRISEVTLEEVLLEMRPGMTERQVVGLICSSLYRHGAECEAYPPYVFSGIGTRSAINRPSEKVIEADELIQLNFGARYGGYASAIGRPLMFGKMPSDLRKEVCFGLDAHLKTIEWISEGVAANDVAARYKRYFFEHGYQSNYLYGPCHGTGIIEVEKPWMESNSTYKLRENMTFMADTFFCASNYGFRWEDGLRVKASGCEAFSSAKSQLLEL